MEFGKGNFRNQYLKYSIHHFSLCKLLGVHTLQSTKQGGFRGSQAYKHDCDIFVEIKNFHVVQDKARGQEATASVAIEQLFSE